jgi:hypothetical protein
MKILSKALLATALFSVSILGLADEHNAPNNSNVAPGYYQPAPYYGGNNNMMPWNNGGYNNGWGGNNNNWMPWNSGGNNNGWGGMPWGNNGGWGNNNVYNDWPIWTPMYWADEMSNEMDNGNWGGNNNGYGNNGWW